MPNRDGKGPQGGGQGRGAGQGQGQGKRAGGRRRRQAVENVPAAKIAISAEGDSLNSNIDLRFGRCNYFMIYNPADKTTEFIQNPGREASGGAGPMAAKLLANQGVTKIISGDFGPKAFDALEAMNIEMITLQAKDESLESLIQKFNH